MDILLLFLMHTLGRLKLTEEDLLILLNRQPDDKSELEEMLVSSPARAFVNENPDWLDNSQKLCEDTRNRGVTWCRFGDPDYPRQWLGLTSKPLLFHYRGLPVWKNHSLLAVVGSRTPLLETRMWMQRELAVFLKRTQLAVVSGGARGVDTWAHRISIDCGRPTICVLPSGVLKPYPLGGEELLGSIVREGGAVLSTFHPFEEMRKSHFHLRNRWIAGFSPLCFVVEANRRSGSSLTAKLASDENRARCTLPVFPHSTQGLANLDLIMEGAFMVRDHADLTTVWNLSSGPGTFEAAYGEEEKDRVNDPKGRESGQPSAARDGFGR